MPSTVKEYLRNFYFSTIMKSAALKSLKTFCEYINTCLLGVHGTTGSWGTSVVAIVK